MGTRWKNEGPNSDHSTSQDRSILTDHISQLAPSAISCRIRPDLYPHGHHPYLYHQFPGDLSLFHDASVSRGRTQHAFGLCPRQLTFCFHEAITLFPSLVQHLSVQAMSLQLVISVILLKSKSPAQITILKASLIGSIVSSLHYFSASVSWLVARNAIARTSIHQPLQRVECSFCQQQ